MKHRIKYALIALGWLSVFLGVIGIFLPLLPTTPFILLAAWCFARSSEPFHNWIINHPKLGPIISDWSSGQGIPKKVRNRALLLLWLSMGISMLIVGKLWLCILLFLIGSATSMYILKQPLQADRDN